MRHRIGSGTDLEYSLIALKNKFGASPNQETFNFIILAITANQLATEGYKKR